MNVRITSAAEWDLLRGAEFYERQLRGLGAYFLKVLSSDIDRLEETGGVHPINHGYYRAVSRKFPYAIFYEIEGNDAIVWAVIDTRRDPNFIESRLG